MPTEALRPIAGVFTFALFAAGIIGIGLLAVPMLAGSGAYALGEALGSRRPARALLARIPLGLRPRLPRLRGGSFRRVRRLLGYYGGV